MTYKKSCLIGAEGMEIITPYIDKIIDGDWSKYTPIENKDEQLTDGDFRIKGRNIELKTLEKDHNGNIFIENWSNKTNGSRLKHGWLHSLTNCDILWYLNIETKKLYIFDFKALWDHCIKYHLLLQYTEVEQTKYNQLNKTTGYWIPPEEINTWELIQL